MTRERLYLFDTTLRDGQQTQGVQFSLAEKQRIATLLDDLGIDQIEGGWPGANPTDSEFFENPPATRATITAFGMTECVVATMARPVIKPGRQVVGPEHTGVEQHQRVVIVPAQPQIAKSSWPFSQTLPAATRITVGMVHPVARARVSNMI